MVNAEWMTIGVRLGMLDLVRTDQEHTLFLGPDILDPAFDPAAANLAGSGTSIGAALLDQGGPAPGDHGTISPLGASGGGRKPRLPRS